MTTHTEHAPQPAHDAHGRVCISCGAQPDEAGTMPCPCGQPEEQH